MTLDERAKKVRLVAMDVDGTLTDSAMFYTADGEHMKRFSTRDGMGVTLLRRSNIVCVLITSEHSEIARKRGEKLQMDHIILGCHDKSAALMELSQKLSIPMEAIAYIGDDVNDGPVMRLTGLAGCPSDAVDAIKEIAHYTCSLPGGHGAVREFAELVLRAQHLPIILPERW